MYRIETQELKDPKRCNSVDKLYVKPSNCPLTPSGAGGSVDKSSVIAWIGQEGSVAPRLTLRHDGHLQKKSFNMYTYLYS